jgi:hypothetical protein
MVIKKLILSAVLFLFVDQICAQAIPSEDEKIPYFTTFSKNAKLSFGDDDFVQVIFFVVPEKSNDPFYVRVYDPDNGGTIDEKVNAFNSKTKFSFYGGKGAQSNKDCQDQNPKGNYKSGVFITGKTFGEDPAQDAKWYEFGPFNPKEGELLPDLGGYVFKMVVEGLDGDDGNLYKLFLSSQKDKNVKVEGANSFYYEYTFRLDEKAGYVGHIYPYILPKVVEVDINTFDYDNAGTIRVVSVEKKGDMFASETEGVWAQVKFKIEAAEIGTSLDIQFINKKEVKNNNVAVYITNQFGEFMPFYSLPIGGVPKYKYKIGVKPSK